MTIFLPSDITIVERIANGDDRVLSMLYDKWRLEFENVLRPNCSAAHQNEIDFEELYQESVLVLYYNILNGKIFINNGKIHCINRYNEVKPLVANLKTYLINTGKKKLQAEIRRVSKNLDIFDRTYMFGDSFSPEDFDNKDYAASPVDTSKDGHGQDLLDWTRQTNEDDVITLVRDIVTNMPDPCKSIFRYIYYGDDGKRMSVKDIMAKMPQYTNEASVRNQTSRCNKKFKETFMKLRNLL